jgi:hypothetical protein
MSTVKRYLSRLEAPVDNPTFLKGTTSAQHLVLYVNDLELQYQIWQAVIASYS